MKNYYQQFSAMKEELESNPLIEVTSFEIEEGLSQANIGMVEDEFKIKVPEEIRAFYREVSTLKFMWVLKPDAAVPLMPGDDTGHVNGKMNITDLYELFTDYNNPDRGKDVLWFEGKVANDAPDQHKNLLPFDFFDNHNAECIAFAVDKLAKNDCSLFLRDSRAQVLTFGKSIDEYMEYIIHKKGFVRSQEALLFPGSVDADRMNYYLPKVFNV